MFKESFKYYKAKNPIPDFSEIVDFENLLVKEDVSIIHPNHSIDNLPPGILPINKWQCYELKNHSGLIFIHNPFTRNGQRYWITRCLQDYPKNPNIINLNPKIFKKYIIDDWWTSLQQENDKKFREKLKNSMRWTTLGYHHNWDTKIYNEKLKNKFPDDLAKLCKFFAIALNLDKKYSAEAAIINYYPIGTTLAGHTDHSESNLEAPLFSFSFGQTAIFLIGGRTKEEKPTGVFLRSGDIVVMSKESRLCYHAVPRIMKTNKELWNDHDPEIRSSEDGSPNTKKLKCNDEKFQFDDYCFNQELWEKCSDENFWRDFNTYLKDSRININVRQVLKEGQISL